MSVLIKVASCQIDIELGNLEKNTAKIIDFIKQAASNGARLIIFPECALTGYCINSKEEAKAHALLAHESHYIKGLRSLCNQLNIYAIIGLIEEHNDQFYNSSILMGPDNFIAIHRKAHTSFVGIDRFVAEGDTPLKVYDLPIGRIGFYICYDHNFPESARTLTLNGVQLICLSTNWSEPAKPIGLAISQVRAFENLVFLACSNRIGDEREAHFIGQSHIIGPYGNILAIASENKEEIIYADLDLSVADQKKVMITETESVDILNDRRPELYGILTKEKND